MPPHLVWMDMEMTGLDPEVDVILEIVAVSSSFTRSMSIVLKLPATCPALAREPIQASTSDQVWV